MISESTKRPSLLPQKTRVDAVVEVLHAAILDGRLPPGTRLNQDRLAQELGVSRMPIREALKQLEMRGLVVLHPYRGAEVSQLSADDVEEIFEMRIALESVAIRRAVPLLKPEHFTELEQILTAMDKAMGNPREWLRLNTRFHATIYRASGWRQLLQTIDELRHNVERYLRLYVSLLGFHEPQEQHWAILEACRARDTQRAEALTHHHLRQTEQLLIQHLRALPTPSLLPDTSQPLVTTDNQGGERHGYGG